MPSLFELDRLRREGKSIILPGGRCALDVLLDFKFGLADKAIDEFYARRRIEALSDDDPELGTLVPPLLLGC